MSTNQQDIHATYSSKWFQLVTHIEKLENWRLLIVTFKLP